MCCLWTLLDSDTIILVNLIVDNKMWLGVVLHIYNHITIIISIILNNTEYPHFVCDIIDGIDDSMLEIQHSSGREFIKLVRRAQGRSSSLMNSSKILKHIHQLADTNRWQNLCPSMGPKEHIWFAMSCNLRDACRKTYFSRRMSRATCFFALRSLAPSRPQLTSALGGEKPTVQFPETTVARTWIFGQCLNTFTCSSDVGSGSTMGTIPPPSEATLFPQTQYIIHGKEAHPITGACILKLVHRCQWLTGNPCEALGSYQNLGAIPTGSAADSNRERAIGTSANIYIYITHYA